MARRRYRDELADDRSRQAAPELAPRPVGFEGRTQLAVNQAPNPTGLLTQCGRSQESVRVLATDDA